ncbi:hypothetical protein MYP_542 [Sporocytophaga myxococcoides]|uniref:Acyltransferase 3 domain-containing protein n=1 Tax=Sporocytophaga myxococcoides TaxID=153721 RepID=A0A098L8Y1_9BACT|nr:acyltransferase [Sporocytophaga myxococcoides]GAL83316.1 hypothetical protein MYP_542 [Sporocytophaga myxococcoides]
MLEQKYFPSLTGVRAVAAIMVYIFHFNPFIPEKFGNRVFSFFDQFNAGVPIFFVLSGFLIASRYQGNVKSNWPWFKQYLLKRFARIYPIYFLLTTITFAIIWLDLHPLPSGTSPKEFNSFLLYLLNITFLKGFFDLFKNTGLPQAWSLSVEECFYLCAPILFLLRTRFNLFLQCCILFVFGLLLTCICSKINFFGFFSSLKFTLGVTFFGRIMEFYIGIKLFDLYKNQTVEKRIQNCFALRTFSGIIGVVLTLILLSNLSDLQILKTIIHIWALPIFIAIVLWGLLTEDSIIRRLLETKIFQLLGKSSYAFYLLHMGFLQILLYNFFNTNYTMVFTSLILISIAVYKFIEEPLQKIIVSRTSTTSLKNLNTTFVKN